jgi:hypothetical protein
MWDDGREMQPDPARPAYRPTVAAQHLDDLPNLFGQSTPDHAVKNIANMLLKTLQTCC